MQSTRMTSAMRQSLLARLREFDAKIDVLRAQCGEDESGDITALLRQLTNERDRILDALDGAVLIDDAPFDTHATEVGDRVTVRNHAGEIETYVLMEGAFSSRAGRNWVSVSSPLGAALLGRSAGDEVNVMTPGGTSIYVVVAFERASEAAAVRG